MMFENNGAQFNDDKTHRLYLWRIWDESKPLVMFIGLNPSTANESENDPTMRRVIGFAKSWDCGGVYMTNLFTIISSSPGILKDHRSWGELVSNFSLLVDISKKCKEVVFCWGNFKEAEIRARECKKYFKDAMCLGRNKNGSPKHPLYVKGDTGLIFYTKINKQP